MSSEQVEIATFYQFHPLADEALDSLVQDIEREAIRLNVRGLMIFGVEGLNTTASGTSEELTSWIQFLETHLELPRLQIKRSFASQHPFSGFKVKRREEIVTIGDTTLVPEQQNRANHLSPEDWQKVLENEKDAVVLDTRNWYETRIGKFSGAIDPGIEEFHEFPEYLKNSGISKDKKVLIYCTGGIRCEKAILEMNRQGFENVFQLDGGILNYLEKFPNQKFDGECFVFDHRVAVDQELKPTLKYGWCPHCGQPSDKKIACKRCDSEAMICMTCEKKEHLQTCSKNCAHHFQRFPHLKGRAQVNRIRPEKQARQKSKSASSKSNLG